MNDRIKRAFSSKAKIAYLTAGDGGERSIDYFVALAQGGANVLEIGVPFSDPVADGVVIQQAMERSLKNGTNLKKVLEITKGIRTKLEQNQSSADVAIIIFTYFNQIQHNLDGFLNEASIAGVDGVLVVDLPFEESDELLFLAKCYNISIIFVASPSTSLSRIKQLSSTTNGFLYYACRKGTTGIRDELPLDIEERIKEVCLNSALPVAVGFGVSNSEMVNKILSIADGCVIGSYFVNKIAENVSPEDLQQLTHNIFGNK
ncbi:MAG: tryptophan synthase subunit alpha [Neisseriaceae bacterium]